MPKITLDDLTNLQNETSAVNTINNNSAAIEAAIENTLSRDGTSPNEMNANLDMNNYRVFNLPAATSPTEPIRKAEFDNLTADISNAGQFAQEAKDARDAAQVAEAGALEAETFAYLWASENEDTPVDDGTRTGYSSFHWSAKSEDHATDSENAKIEAQVARDFARDWATEAEDVPVDDGVNPPGFSAYHWAQKAEEVVLGGVNASAIEYDNAVSGLTATNVQDAIDESDGRAVRKNVTASQVMSGPLVVRQSLEVRANPGGNINVALTDESGTEVALIYAVPSTGFFALRRNLGGGSFATLKFLPTSITYNDNMLWDASHKATTMQVRSGTTNRILTSDNVWAAAGYVGLSGAAGSTLAAGTYAPNFNAGINFYNVLGDNITIGDPTNAKPGQTGLIVLQQDATGGRTVAFGSAWKFANNTVPPMNTAADRVNVIAYQVLHSGFVIGSTIAGLVV